MLDIDHFKLINDNFGHQAGDKALQAVSSVCRTCLRKEDGVGRIGGEEFAFILPDTNLAGAEEVAEKLRQRIERLAIHHQDQAIDIRTSIGCATLDGSEASHESLLSHADQALYQAKAMGRNRIHAYQNEF
jgi:diguanylate cyclase (GGDEF)-like protein